MVKDRYYVGKNFKFKMAKTNKKKEKKKEMTLYKT